jgi:two-component system response regulator AtoC
MERLSGYGWPGNIRELENVIERAVLFADGNAHPPRGPRGGAARRPRLRRGRARHAHAAGCDGGRRHFPERRPQGAGEGRDEPLERDLILRALLQTQHNVTHAARLLKISRKGLQLKMKELNLRERDQD